MPGRLMAARRSASASLEREVILAVVILYVLICAAMLAIHHLQPVLSGGAAPLAVAPAAPAAPLAPARP